MAYSYEQGIIDGDKTQEKFFENNPTWVDFCLLYTSDAADE